MGHLFDELPFDFVYLEDIVIANKDATEHESLIQKVFRRLDQYHVQSLGYQVSTDGISPFEEIKYRYVVTSNSKNKDFSRDDKFLEKIYTSRRTYTHTLARVHAQLTLIKYLCSEMLPFCHR